MNDGLLGFPSVSPTTRAIGAVYRATASLVYVASPEPVVDTALLDDGGALPLECRFSLPSPRTVLVRVVIRLLKGNASHGLRCALYDNGVKVAPATALHVAGWYSRAAAGSLHYLFFDAALSLDTGQHVLDVRHQAYSGTSASTFHDRLILAEVVAP
jgi:hypothetical protein